MMLGGARDMTCRPACLPADRDAIGSDTICVIGVAGLLRGAHRSARTSINCATVGARARPAGVR